MTAIEPPEIVQAAAQELACIHLQVPHSEIQKVMSPGLEEVRAAVSAQGIQASGPWFTHHLRIGPEGFDFEICLPVAKTFVPAGCVEPGVWPAGTMARTCYRGPYEGLPGAWGAFDAWIAEQGFTAGEDLFEVYALGPESSDNPSGWRTELWRPIRDDTAR